MSYKTITSIYSISIIIGIIIGTILVLRLIVGIFRKNNRLIASSLKYIIHSLTFIFVAIVYISFAIVVNGPQGEERKEWIKKESMEWFLIAIGITLTMAILNNIYQIKIEKNKDLRKTIILSILDFLIMCYGIFIGAQIGLAR
jgi:NADH:ubiquinone oxidoreductase subunit 4 (subunit M)